MGLISNNFTHTSLASWTNDDSVVDVFPMQQAPFPATVPWLFFRKEQLALQSAELIYSFILTSKDSGGVSALFHCIPGPHGWISPPLAPFGGIATAGPCHTHQLAFLLSCVREWITFKQGSALIIKTAPSCYDPCAHEMCHRSYLAAGFFPNHTHSNHYIPITATGFDLIIEPAERRRLSKGKRSGLRVTLHHGISDNSTERFLRRCYHAHGHKFPLAPDQLARLATVFPENYVVFSNRLRDEPVAVAVMVRISDGILYHFLSGYLPEYRSLSPAVMLFEAAFNYCSNEKIDILDLGISIDHLGNPKPSLSRFKANLGGLECKKIVYTARF